MPLGGSWRFRLASRRVILHVLDGVVQAVEEVVIETRVLRFHITTQIPGDDTAVIAVDTVEPLSAVLHDDVAVGGGRPCGNRGCLLRIRFCPRTRR